MVLMDSQCGVPPHWPRPPPVYKGPQQWDDGAQLKGRVEKLEVAGNSWEAMRLATKAGDLEAAGGINITECSYDQGSGMGGGSRSSCNKGGCSSGGSSTGESGAVSGGSSIGGGSWTGGNSKGYNMSSSIGGVSSLGGGNTTARCSNGGGNETNTGVVEELEEAQDNWKTTLLAILLQLCKLLALHTGGATGTWRQLRRRRGKVRQARGGDRGDRAVQQWWRLLRSYIHQQRCRRQQKGLEAKVEEAHGGAAVGATKEAMAAAAKAGGGTNGWGGNRTSCWS